MGSKITKISLKERFRRTGSELRLNNCVLRDPNEIANAWGDFFTDLYGDTTNEQYDNSFHDYVQSTVNNLKRSPSGQYRQREVTKEELNLSIRELNSGKMCGPDGIYSEHLVLGGERLSELVLTFLNKVLTDCYIPLAMKKGIIITLHKGGQKPMTDPKSYRAITLSSSILKLYESVLLRRIKAEINVPIHALQGGFQAGMGCMVTTFLTKECIAYCNENKSKLFA